MATGHSLNTQESFMGNDSAELNPKSQKTILVVDDTPENLTVMGEILMPFYSVRVASSGQRALAVMKSSQRPDLVLLDVMMPEMNGYQVIDKIRSAPETADIPVIFVTALGSSEDETHGLDLGAVDYITKPYKPAIVLSRIRTQLELKEARDRLKDQNSWLEAEVARRMRQNEMIRNVTTRALASLAEMRDNETGNHILRTKSYVNVLATELVKLDKYKLILTPDTIDKITNAAPLHDIGKIGTPDHILHKPGKHTPEEWEIMKQHAKNGADAIWRAIQNEDDIEGLDFLYKAMEIARGHHEKFDGTGYPEGLMGESIPISARIMALADVFDALISKRVYKPAFTIEQATEIILQGRGQHFDPIIVDAYLACKDEFIRIANQYADTTN